MNELHYRKGTVADTELILRIWEKSVRATHSFLKEKDRKALYQEIPTYLPHLEIQLWEKSGEIIGFSAIAGDRLEMLFLDPDAIGKGFGRQIIVCLVKEFNIRFVDVNEQNEGAKAFYLKQGFKVVKRNPFDNEGRAYPILELAR